MAEGGSDHAGEDLTLHFGPEAADHVRELAGRAGLTPAELVQMALEDEELFLRTTPIGRLAVTAAKWFATKRIPEPVDDSNVIWVDFSPQSPDIPPEPPIAL
jgi:hypothetical protein